MLTPDIDLHFTEINGITVHIADTNAYEFVTPSGGRPPAADTDPYTRIYIAASGWAQHRQADRMSGVRRGYAAHYDADPG